MAASDMFKSSKELASDLEAKKKYPYIILTPNCKYSKGFDTGWLDGLSKEDVQRLRKEMKDGAELNAGYEKFLYFNYTNDMNEAMRVELGLVKLPDGTKACWCEARYLRSEHQQRLQKIGR